MDAGEFHLTQATAASRLYGESGASERNPQRSLSPWRPGGNPRLVFSIQNRPAALRRNPRSGAVVPIDCSILDTSENNLLLRMIRLRMIRPHVGWAAPTEEFYALSPRGPSTCPILGCDMGGSREDEGPPFRWGIGVSFDPGPRRVQRAGNYQVFLAMRF
jgi:hypothetical protein